MIPVGIRGVVPREQLEGDDEAETKALASMMAEADGFLSSHAWCRSIDEQYFGFGVAGVILVALFRISGDEGVDPWLWVIVGDLPSAYLVTDAAHTPAQAISVYCDLMQEWIDAVRAGRSRSEVYPVRAEPTVANANALESRLEFLRSEIVPEAR